jgi:hypothetical protein
MIHWVCTAPAVALTAQSVTNGSGAEVESGSGSDRAEWSGPTAGGAGFAPPHRWPQEAGASSLRQACEMAFDLCPFCGSRVEPTRTTMWTVQLICQRCERRRQASDRETDDWLGVLPVPCPVCEGGMRVRRAGGLDLVCASGRCPGVRVIGAVEAAAKGEPLPEPDL